MRRRRAFFLDTTIQVDRLFERTWRKNYIRQRLAGRECMTCSMVLREFKRNVIDTCISLLLIISECETDTDVETEISRQFTKSTVSMMLKIYAEVKREALITGRFDKELIVATLKEYIKGRLLSRFNEVLTMGMRDAVKCDVALRSTTEAYGMYSIDVSCNRVSATCDLPKVFKENGRWLTRISDALRIGRDLEAKGKAELERICRVLERARENSGWAVLKGNHNCDRVADLTIVLEAPRGASVYSTDKHYELLARYVGIPRGVLAVIERYGRRGR